MMQTMAASRATATRTTLARCDLARLARHADVRRQRHGQVHQRGLIPLPGSGRPDPGLSFDTARREVHDIVGKKVTRRARARRGRIRAGGRHHHRAGGAALGRAGHHRKSDGAGRQALFRTHQQQRRGQRPEDQGAGGRRRVQGRRDRAPDQGNAGQARGGGAVRLCRHRQYRQAPRPTRCWRRAARRWWRPTRGASHCARRSTPGFFTSAPAMPTRRSTWCSN